MPIVRRLVRLNRTVQMALVAAAAFAIGSATVASASIAGIPVGSLFYLPMINGTATTPCSTTATNTTTCNAIVDSSGNLHVSSTGTSTVTGSVGVNNFPGDQQVHGSVSVSNLSADQMIHGMVGINNFPDIQKVSGTVNIGNLPATQAVNGTVNVGNLPATQAVNGTVNVGNLPTDQQIHGSVTVTNLPAATGSGGVELIPLVTQALTGDTLSYGNWHVDISSCRKVGVEVDSSNRHNVKLYVSGVSNGFIDLDTKERHDAIGTTLALVFWPGTNEPYFGGPLSIAAFNSDPSPTNVWGNLICAH